MLYILKETFKNNFRATQFFVKNQDIFKNYQKIMLPEEILCQLSV